jgi:hypothetical protein
MCVRMFEWYLIKTQTIFNFKPNYTVELQIENTVTTDLSERNVNRDVIDSQRLRLLRPIIYTSIIISCHLMWYVLVD